MYEASKRSIRKIKKLFGEKTLGRILFWFFRPIQGKAKLKPFDVNL